MAQWGRRIVTGHDEDGKSVVLSDGYPPQGHPMHGPEVGADFTEIWHEAAPVPELAATPVAEPNGRPFTIMPPSGHLMRFIELYPASQGGKKTVMHRTSTIDYALVIEGEVVLHLTDSEVVMRPGDVVVQRGTDHAWENRSDSVTRMAFFHLDARFAPELLDTLPRPLDLMR
ncbi:cupin domain-containing protein [Alteraurantiacibacter aquimixticola]|uniref:Cupin domain-containing protein n=1 Tax=Alteraurantiacibacter aquimixticola TaxID=2489173 RepID=A0A4T3F4V8_9SPHN|nr:cupin domain-containing protein [Alteraurantiacibacter aquimixticola]TIX49753.1 cupin domain-containing protein [Alteraurantiacibacter aquimixticola]